MEKLSRVVGFLDAYLDIGSIADGSCNGLQFEGRGIVKKIICAVDAGVATFTEAAQRHADMVVVHHGQYWKYADPRYIGATKKRLEILRQNNISLYAAHLPLDLHPTAGNNALLLKLISARKAGPFARYEGVDISFWGTFSRPKSLDAIVATLSGRLGAVCTVLPFGPGMIRTVGVVSGGGGRQHFVEAVNRRLDLYITGDSTEVFHDARDSGINVVFGGHHATETLGVKELARILRKRLKVETVYVDIPTGL